MAAKGDSPYSTSFASGKIDYHLDPTGQMKKYKREEQETKPLQVLPYELSNIPTYCGAVTENAFHAARTLEALVTDGKYKNRKDLADLQKNLEKIVIYLSRTVDPVLSRYTIGYKEEESEDELDIS